MFLGFALPLKSSKDMLHSRAFLHSDKAIPNSGKFSSFHSGFACFSTLK